MAETTPPPANPAQNPAAPNPAELEALQGAGQPSQEPTDISVRALLEVGAHFGHQTQRWNPKMKKYIFGDRHGVHIINLDRTATRLRDAMDFLRETVAAGGKVLFVGTKRQGQAPVKTEALRCKQFYVNNRWLGGMLTNFRTVRKSLDRYRELLELFADEERAAELSKKERSRLNREAERYQKGLEGLLEMTRLPEAMFVIDVRREHIAVNEARRLGIPIVAIVDTNCDPEGIDYVVPANDDATRAILLYCAAAADACLEGDQLHEERIQAEVSEETTPGRREAATPAGTGRRVVEIKQPPRRGRGRPSGPGGTRSAGSEPEVAPLAPSPAPSAPAGGGAAPASAQSDRAGEAGAGAPETTKQSDETAEPTTE